METKEPKKQDVKILNNKCEPEMCFIRAGYVVVLWLKQSWGYKGQNKFLLKRIL